MVSLCRLNRSFLFGEAAIKRYVTLKCSTCDRTRDQLIDPKHYTTDKCTITLGCEGRLAPVGYTSDSTTVAGVAPIGLTNWFPRNQNTTGTVSLKGESLYDTSTGSKQQFVVAISDTVLGSVPPDNAVVKVRLIAEQQISREYRQYVYRKTSSFSVINGVEDGLAKKVLRYTVTGPSPDLVEVYVDGIKRTAGTGSDQYRLYDGTVGSPVPPNSVLFNSIITGVAPQVDVIVTKAATVSELELTLARMTDDDSRKSLGAWEGVDAVKNQATGERYSLFYADFSEMGTTVLDVKLRINLTPSPASFIAPTVSNIDPSKAFILLSREKLHTSVDRQRAMWVPLASLTGSTNYLMIKIVDEQRVLLVTEDSAKDVFPVLQVLQYNAPSLLRTGLRGNSSAAQLDNMLINGPDA